MTDQEAFEKWALSVRGDYSADEMRRMTQEIFENAKTPGPLSCAWAAWQACAEHYEAVMRRAVEMAITECGDADLCVDPWPLADDIIARAKEEG